MSNSHTHSNAELGVELPVCVAELSDDLITIDVDQPRPPAHNEEYSAPLSCSESRLSPPCSGSQPCPSSHDPSGPHPSACSDHTHVKETASNQQPLPLHEQSSESPSQITTNSEQCPLIENSNFDSESTTINDRPLVPSNQLLFELD